MTLPPIYNRRVRAVASERYPINRYCSSPTTDATERATEPHHCFRRSAIGGDSWFVEIEEDDGSRTVIPHVTGLSHEAHRQITEHEAWIRFEQGIWNWYERQDSMVSVATTEGWTLVGPLNPQPGSVESKGKKKRYKGEERRKRKTISIRIPEGSDAETYDLLMEQASEIVTRELGLQTPYPYIVLEAALQNFIENYGLVVS